MDLMRKNTYSTTRGGYSMPMKARFLREFIECLEHQLSQLRHQIWQHEVSAPVRTSLFQPQEDVTALFTSQEKMSLVHIVSRSLLCITGGRNEGVSGPYRITSSRIRNDWISNIWESRREKRWYVSTYRESHITYLLMIEGVTIVLREWILHTVVIVHCDGSRFYHTRDWHEIQWLGLTGSCLCHDHTSSWFSLWWILEPILSAF